MKKVIFNIKNNSEEFESQVENHTEENDFDNFICYDFDRVKDIVGVPLTKILKKELGRKIKQ